MANWSLPGGNPDQEIVSACFAQMVPKNAHLYLPTHARLYAFVAGAAAALAVREYSSKAAAAKASTAAGKPTQTQTAPSSNLLLWLVFALFVFQYFCLFPVSYPEASSTLQLAK